MAHNPGVRMDGGRTECGAPAFGAALGPDGHCLRPLNSHLASLAPRAALSLLRVFCRPVARAGVSRGHARRSNVVDAHEVPGDVAGGMPILVLSVDAFPNSPCFNRLGVDHLC